MSFSDLLDSVDALSGPLVGINPHVVPLVKEHSAQDSVEFVSAQLDTEISFGHCLRYRQRSQVYGEPRWTIQVRYARDLNICWQRFVCCKELMHAFDPPEANTNSVTKFAELVTNLELEGVSETPAILAERATVWKAMAVLAPPRLISQFDDAYKQGDIDDYEIALTLRIPQFYVPHIMNPNFDSIVKRFRDGG